jgi:hypothetical protein
VEIKQQDYQISSSMKIETNSMEKRCDFHKIPLFQLWFFQAKINSESHSGILWKSRRFSIEFGKLGVCFSNQLLAKI